MNGMEEGRRRRRRRRRMGRKLIRKGVDGVTLDCYQSRYEKVGKMRERMRRE